VSHVLPMSDPSVIAPVIFPSVTTLILFFVIFFLFFSDLSFVFSFLLFSISIFPPILLSSVYLFNRSSHFLVPSFSSNLLTSSHRGIHILFFISSYIKFQSSFITLCSSLIFDKLLKLLLKIPLNNSHFLLLPISIAEGLSIKVKIN